MLLTTLLQVLLVSLLYSGERAWAATSTDANVYLNKVISSHLRQEVTSHNLDPADLPSFNTTFRDTFIGINVNVKVVYTRGHLDGLSTVKNLMNCSAPVESYGNYSISCYLGFRDLEMHYDSKLKYGQMPKVSVSASAAIKGTTIAVDITTNPAKNVPYLRRFDVREIGVITPKYTGLGPLNRYLDMMTNTFLRTATADLMHGINFRFKDAVALSVTKVEMPTT